MTTQVLDAPVEEAAPVERPNFGIGQYRNARHGETIYVVAAGGSLNYLDPAFFADKCVVAVNEIASRWGVHADYGVCKEQTTLEEVAPLGYPLMASLHENGHTANVERASDRWPNVRYFPHVLNKAEGFDVFRDWPSDPDALVVSMSTITTGMHFAAYLGAAWICVVGHDCGQVGDVDYVKGYTAPTAPWKEPWLIQIEKQSIAIKRELLRRYAPTLRGIYGLSPFMTPNLEGVPYRGQNRINDW